MGDHSTDLSLSLGRRTIERGARMQLGGGHTIIQSQHLPFDLSYRNLSNDTFPYPRKIFLLGKKAFIIRFTTVNKPPYFLQHYLYSSPIAPSDLDHIVVDRLCEEKTMSSSSFCLSSQSGAETLLCQDLSYLVSDILTVLLILLTLY